MKKNIFHLSFRLDAWFLCVIFYKHCNVLPLPSWGSWGGFKMNKNNFSEWGASRSGRSILPAGHLLAGAKTRLPKLKSLCRNGLTPSPLVNQGYIRPDRLSAISQRANSTLRKSYPQFPASPQLYHRAAIFRLVVGATSQCFELNLSGVSTRAALYNALFRNV